MESSLFEIQLKMPESSAWIALAIAIILLLVSAIISGSEVAFFSLSPKEKESLDGEKHPVDALIQKLLNRSERLMAAILIGNNLVNVAIIMLFSLFMSGVIASASTFMVFMLETVILTFLLLLFGEVMPKVFASHHAMSFSRRVAPLMNSMTHIFSPFISLLVGSTGFVNRRLADKMGEEVTVEDLADAMKLTPQVARNKEEKKILEGIIQFADKTVKDVMTSRSEIMALDVKASFPTALKLVVEQHYSRIPVYEETDDHIKGILYVKDMLPYLNESEQFRWQKLIRPAYYVPENKMIDDLLDDFRRKRLHMAIVVDEFGGTSGLITMEDVLEEIVGEIHDEYDDDEQTWQKVGKNEWIFEARTSLSDFCRVIGIDVDDLGDKADNCESIGGLLMEIKQGFLKIHEEVRFRNLEFTVLAMDRRRIDRVRIKKQL